MSQTQQLPFSEGDSIVDRENATVWHVVSIDGDNVTLDGLSAYADDTQPLDAVLTGMEERNMEVVSDSPLTDIPYIGGRTAPQIVAATGCETPSELIAEYLVKGFDIDEVPNLREDVLHAALLDPQFAAWAEDDVWVTYTGELGSRWKATVMGFIRVLSVASSCDAIGGGASRTRYGYKKREVEASDVDFGEDTYITDAANVCAMCYSRDHLTEIDDNLPWDEYVEGTVNDTDKNEGVWHVRINTEEEYTLVSGDYLEQLQTLLPFDVTEYVYAHPDGEYPIFIDHPEHVGCVALASRIE